MFKRGMDNKGQLSVEYLLLLVVIFVVFGAMITYLVGPSIDSANDISDVSGASNAVNTIANAANIVYANGPNSKRTIQIYIPQDMIITTSYNGVSANITLSNGTIKTVSAKTSYPLQANTFNVSKGNKKALVRWYTGDPYLANYIGS
ncbi:hypothetical protein [Methanobacterium sp.]|uniref:hypothetical protein n=1 Tax=Methanobacterium sp. TaxID=2164 RepID=UPI00315942E6